MGGPGSGRPTKVGDVRFVLVLRSRSSVSIRRITRATLEQAQADGDDQVRRRLADRYEIERIEVVARRSRD